MSLEDMFTMFETFTISYIDPQFKRKTLNLDLVLPQDVMQPAFPPPWGVIQLKIRQQA